MNTADAFRQIIQSAGLVPPSLIPMGQLIRFPGIGKSNGNKSGWAWISADGQVGAYGDWASGLSETWHAQYDHAMTAAERAVHIRGVAELRRIRKDIKRLRHAEVAQQAQRLWDGAKPAPANHPYLRRKSIHPHGLRVDDENRLIVPVMIGGSLTSTQSINDTGAKLFLPGGAVKGGSYTIGDLTEATTVLICEGFATGASLHEATDLPVMVAFSASNLAPVAKHLRQQFPTAMIVIGSDNDRNGTGQHAAREAAEAVNGVVVLPETVEKDFNDVHVQLGLDTVKAAIEVALSAAQPRTPNKPEGAAAISETLKDANAEHAQDNRPELDCGIGDLDEVTRCGWGVIQTCNAPPKLFLYGSSPSRIERDDDEQTLRIVPLTPDRLRFHAAQLARCTKLKKTDGAWLRVNCRPPMDVIKNMLAAPEIPLPPLSRIVEVPVFSSAGDLVQCPGYDATAQIYYQPYSFLMTTLSVPAAPTTAEVATAKARLDDLLSDFPFVSAADHTHAVGLAIGPLVRDLIDGPIPLHVAESPGPGSGKNLLVEVVLHPSVGRRIGAIAEARDDDEWRKRLTARLLEGCPVTLIDNLSRPLDSGTVASVLTARRWEDRRLGKNETIAVPVRTIFVCTANNPLFSMEIVRRSIRIRLDPRMDRPWMRDGFRHSNLRTFVEQERPALIVALLTLTQAWLKAGRPRPAAQPLGSFESWSHIVGGILEFAGYTNFLGNALEFYEAADSEGMIWRLFVTSWWKAYQGQTVSVKELFDIATAIDGFYLGRGTSERGQKTVLGHSLKRHRDQIVDAFRIKEVGIYANGVQWRLQQIATPSLEPEFAGDIENITLK